MITGKGIATELCQAGLIMTDMKQCNQIATRKIMDVDKNIVHLCAKHFRLFVNENMESIVSISGEALKEALGDDDRRR